MKSLQLNYLLGVVFILFAIVNTNAQKKESKKESTSRVEAFMLPPPDGGDGEEVSIWNRDADNDGYGNPYLQIESSTKPSGYVSNNLDCNDGNSSIHPGATEVYDGVDNDCDGLIDEGFTAGIPSTPTIQSQDCSSATLSRGTPPSGVTWYWQGTNSAGTSTSNSNSTYMVSTSGRYYLRARNNSSGLWSTSSSYIDVTLGVVGGTTWYADTDGDLLGDPSNTKIQCTQPSGYVNNSDDQCPTIHGGGSATGCPSSSGLSNENYVYTVIPQVPTTSTSSLTNTADAIRTITYYDGLGRPKQNIAIKQSPNEKDIVTHVEYDAFGRQTKEYLPYAVATNNGGIITGDVATATQSYYQAKHSDDFAGVSLPDVNAYSEKQFDGSPLNRVLKQAAPGKDWKLGNGHEIKFDYQTNISGEVRVFGVTTTFTNNTYTPTLTGGTSDYPAGELYKTVTKDENHDGSPSKLHTTEEFKNKQGQVILKRTYALVANVETAHDTYYVYDDFGNLTYVLPPKSEPHSAKPDATELSELCYQYKYDYRNHLVEKKIPGKGWEYIIYDKLDRPVLTQDANQRGSRKWLFTKYDALGRVVYTGIYTHGSVSTQVQMQSHFDTQNNTAEKYYEEKKDVAESLGIYYTNTDFPTTSIEVLTINYYDNYTFDRAGANISVSGVYGVNSTENLKSLATGSKVKILGSSPTKWTTTVTYYDEKARPIYVYSKNDELGTTDIVESNLDFSGKVLETKTTHKKSGKADIVILDKFKYDHMDRLINQTQTIGNHTEAIVSNEYDDLGQLKTKKVGGNLQTVDYTYNIRGWLKNINQDGKNDNDLFNFTIKYNDPTSGTPLFNGNISQTSWNTLNVDLSSKTYTYSYDALNRITSAMGTSTSNYNVSGITYDKNGNIQTLYRNGYQGGSVFTDMDKLVYSYNNGNQLIKVLDNGNDTYGFKDGANTSIEYTYDANGNMTIDANKGITSITYNHLNLPVSVTSAGGTIGYTYDAAGNKLRKIAGSTTTDYAGNFIYENGELQFFNHPEGYLKNDAGTFNYVYQYKDQVGNTRLSYSDLNNDGIIQPATEILREQNYFPFGLEHKGYNSNIIGVKNDKKQFQGQEFTEDLGLNIHEWKYRVSDPAIGRFWQIDPLAEDFYHNSTHAFSENRVIDAVELEGLEKISIHFLGKLTKNNKTVSAVGSVSLDVGNNNKINYGVSVEGMGTLVGSYSGKEGNKGRIIKNNPKANKEVESAIEEGVKLPDWAVSIGIGKAKKAVNPSTLDEALSLDKETAELNQMITFGLNTLNDLVESGVIDGYYSYDGSESIAENKDGKKYKRKFTHVYKGKFKDFTFSKDGISFKGKLVLEYKDQKCTENCDEKK